ncbi:Ger(x)C family spore germination C-terminal domain-containing protein [Brevibacillus humidisoli]|uniref:Ger(x)C family spore germination C-terminal domain-containing protein n=1 Tax=Brevibacillus humidisoli TaxID=2895522 RepID=UPI001E5EF88F|nr:Ger(x)C family spore germination C-terminal domain-containing protein [Brevibacillus humidisoli]UFJ39140.1 Ger(x)C family spore germination C-terminal domain-containing protein [Brevibacillus humidisoli]
MIKVHLPDVKGELSIELEELRPKEHVSIQNDKPVFRFTVKAKGRVMENTTNLDLSNPRIISDVTDAFAKTIKQEYERLLKKLQKTCKTDSASMGAMIYRSHPAYWRKIEADWPDMFTRQEIQWTVDARISSIGVAGPPMSLPEGEVKK